MRPGYAALVLGSLVLQKDLSGGPSVRSRTPREADGRDGPAGFCPEENLLSHFQHLLCSQGFCWISETTWGLPLAGAALLLLWLGFELWSSCCLASWQAQLLQPVATESPAAQPSPPPLPEAESEEEKDLPASHAKHSGCICGRQRPPDFESYELPCQAHRHPYEPSQTPRNVCQDENVWQKHPPSPPPLLRSSSSSSSSPLPSGSSSCWPLLKHLNLCCRVATDASWTMRASSDTSEASSSSDSSSSESEALRFLKNRKQRGPSFIPLFPERLPEIKGAPLLPENHPEIKGVPQTSFAQINFVQSSTFEKEDQVILVEKSLEIRMGPLPDPGSLPRLRTGDEEDAGEKPPPLPLLDHVAMQRLDFRVKEQKEELAKATEKSSPKPPSEKEEEEPPPPKVTAEPAGAVPPGPEEVPTVLKGMDDKSRDFLEFHIKKKMVQRRCGVPTVVVNSVNLFQPVGKKSFRGDLKRTLLLIPSDAGAPAQPPLLPRNAMAVYMKPFQEPPRAKGCYAFHKAKPEEMRKGGFPAPEEKLGLKPRDSQRSQRNDVLFSVEPEKLRKLLFHLTVKMVEIQKVAFPEMVEDSLRTFSILSVKPLPKLIHFGNKISRPKHLALTFVAKEALCIIDFNISHKFMVFTWGIPMPHSKPTEKATPGLSKATQHPSSPEKGVPQKPPVPILVLKAPRKGASTPGGGKQILLVPKAQPPRRTLLAPAEEPPQEVQFRDLFKQSSLASSAPSKKAKGPAPQPLATPLGGTEVAPGEGMQPKKAALAMLCPRSQGATGKGSPSTKQEAPREKTADKGKIGALKTANVQEELQDLPAPLEEGEKAEGKETGSKKEGDQQGEPGGALPSSALPPAFQRGAGAGSQRKAGGQAGPPGGLPAPSPERRGASEKDGDQRGELEGTMRYTASRAGAGSEGGEHPQAELEGAMLYRGLPAPSPERRGASERDGDQRGELEGTMRYTASRAGAGSEGGEHPQAELEGAMLYRGLPAPSPEGRPSQRAGGEGAELEGTIRYGAPSETPPKGAAAGGQRNADRPAELEGSLRYASTGAGAASRTDGDDQAELEGAMRCSALLKPAAESAQGLPREAGQGRGQADEGGGAAGLKEGRSPVRKEPRERAPRGEALSLSVGLQAAGGQRDAPPTRAGLFLRLHLTRGRLHLHLQKRLEAALRPRQRAGLSLRVETGAGEHRAPARPFCYACRAKEPRGAAGKTVCWTLPQRILDMNGGRVPQVARPERPSGEPLRGGPRRPARRRRDAGQGRPKGAPRGAIKPSA